MDLERLQTIINWMRRSPLQELEIVDGTFRARLVRGYQGGAVPASSIAETRDADGAEIAAPSYGIVHMAPSPGTEPFVGVGSKVEAGQPLCVIEAMKAFTHIEAERAGTVTAILVEDGAEVSAGQPIFRLD